MAVGILFTPPRLGITPAAAAKLYVYEPGGTTPRSTYSDAALTTANANPVVADSAGLWGPIYLDPALGYKIVVKTSADVEIFSQDNAYLPTAYLAPQVCQGRLTLTSATPVTASDVTAATSVYFTPYGGNRVALYDTTAAGWRLHSFTERTLALTGLAADTNYDVFLYDNAGTLTLEAVAWTSATARATAITLQDGVYCKSGTLSKRYLGTFRTTGTIGQTEDSVLKRYLWNYYHRMRRPLRVADATDSWTYTTATWRQANGSAANQVDVVVGVAEVAISLRVSVGVSNGTAGVNVAVGIGEDATNVLAADTIYGASTTLVTTGPRQQISASLDKMPAIGRHFYPWIEFSSATGTSTWVGDDGQPTMFRSGMTGAIEG